MECRQLVYGIVRFLETISNDNGLFTSLRHPYASKLGPDLQKVVMNFTKSAPVAHARFSREVFSPFLFVSIGAGAVSMAAIVAAFVLPAEYGRYLTFLPAIVPLVAMYLLWRLLAPSLRSAFASEDELAPIAVEERKFAAMESAAGGHSGPQKGGAALSLAYTDPLTGLGNKMRMHEKFKRLSQARESGQAAFTIGLVNLDGMKPINDLFGYAGGNEVIKQCAMRLAAAVEGDGFVCRYGGDEFAFIFPYVADETGAAEKGRLLQSVLLAPFDLEGSTVRLSGSFGFAVHPHAGETIENVMGNIDTALYHSKRNGRGRVTVYSGELEAVVRENARIEQALRNAVANNEVAPHFQPIISLQDGSLLGFESLARWIDPELGFVSPAKFIPLAEERGIIASLTESLLLQAARAAAEWPEELFLSFNLSSIQLVDPSTAQSIKDVIKRAGLPPHRLEIEVTETAMMSDPETASMIIDELHRAGIRISMDDFGTGQSSLGRLRELKLDKVKIDRAFIMAIGEDKPAEHIVRAILEMCAGLELTVVAEGIEELRQAESLKRYGCHAGQGYLFGKPQDAHKTMGYIRDFMREVEQPPLVLAHAV
jgi:diguanylate cyclase (GGDEF)-like protein